MERSVQAQFIEQAFKAETDFFRAVAIRAEVAEDDTAEAGMGDIPDEFLNLHVGEVAMAGGDALFDRPRTFRIEFQQFVIIIGFDKKSGQVFQALFDAFGDKPGIRQQAEAEHSI